MKNVFVWTLEDLEDMCAKQLNQLGHEIMAVDWNEESR